ncbi:MAG: hypothetical protein JRI25_20085 [Deltaproteobacteria bacterium]|nr:hypothetical protein [Deltaproteobacteria bacterium]
MLTRLLMFVFLALLRLPQASAAEVAKIEVVGRSAVRSALAAIADSNDNTVHLAASDEFAKRVIIWVEATQPNAHFVRVSQLPESATCGVQVGEMEDKRGMPRIGEWRLTVVGDCGDAWQSAWSPVFVERARYSRRQWSTVRYTRSIGTGTVGAGLAVVGLAAVVGGVAFPGSCAGSGSWICLRPGHTVAALGMVASMAGVPMLAGGSMRARRMLLSRGVRISGWPGYTAWGFYAAGTIAFWGAVLTGNEMNTAAAATWVLAGTYAIATGTGIAQLAASRRSASKVTTAHGVDRSRPLVVSMAPLATPELSGVVLSGLF